MTIDEAIKILSDLDTTLPQADPELRREAVQLGREALKKIKECQSHNCTLSNLNLPGETED